MLDREPALAYNMNMFTFTPPPAPEPQRTDAWRILRRGLIWGALVWAGFFIFAVSYARWNGVVWGLGAGAIFGVFGLIAGVLTGLQDSSQEN